ncbi:hypothetical protein DL96DRAFT_1718369 [Flagelloscypha sp. PMI_526]|nr:hypothetical protein DL96DRAFT_1718369 [Flagelloscypha sp. PMI_526]
MRLLISALFSRSRSLALQMLTLPLQTSSIRRQSSTDPIEFVPGRLAKPTSNDIDLCDDLPGLDDDLSGQSRPGPDLDSNFLDDPVLYGERSPCPKETGIAMDDPSAELLEDRAFVSLNILPESEIRPNFDIYDNERNLKPDMPNFSGAIMNDIVLPVLKHAKTLGLTVPHANDLESLFGEEDWLSRLSDESSVYRYAVEVHFPLNCGLRWDFVEEHEGMTHEDIPAFALPHNPGYVYVAVTGEEKHQHLDTYISQLPLVSPDSSFIPVEERASELAFPPAPDAYDLHPRDRYWVQVLRGLYANDFGYVECFHHSNNTTRPYPIVEVLVIPRVCLNCYGHQLASGKTSCACRVRRPDPVLHAVKGVLMHEELFKHSECPWGIEPNSGLHRILLPASYVIHSPYITPSVWAQFSPQFANFPHLSQPTRPFTPDELFPLFYPVVWKQNGYNSPLYLILSSAFPGNVESPHDLLFSLLPLDQIPE